MCADLHFLATQMTSTVTVGMLTEILCLSKHKKRLTVCVSTDICHYLTVRKFK